MNRISRELLSIAREINALENTKWTKVGQVWEAYMMGALAESYLDVQDYTKFKEWFARSSAQEISQKLNNWGLGNDFVTNLFIFTEIKKGFPSDQALFTLIQDAGGDRGGYTNDFYYDKVPTQPVKLDKYTILTPKFYFCADGAPGDFESDFQSGDFGKKYAIYWNGKKMQEFEDASDFYKLQEIK